MNCFHYAGPGGLCDEGLGAAWTSHQKVIGTNGIVTPIGSPNILMSAVVSVFGGRLLLGPGFEVGNFSFGIDARGGLNRTIFRDMASTERRNSWNYGWGANVGMRL